MFEQESTNSYGICNFDPESDCANCPVNERLFCHYDIRNTLRFLAFILPVFVAHFVGLARSHSWKFLWAWVGAFLFFLQVPENFILCRHCPYYAEGPYRTLRCYANFGLLKLWKYTPRPMARWEKTSFLGALLVLGGAPVLVNVKNGQKLAAIGGVVSTVGWVWAMRRSVCVECPNFSCPLNVVPQDIRQAYFERNPRLAEGWGIATDQSRQN
jgi:hypothetical protein